ncbi:hypothetical protein EVB78_141 [Rhizobium phage RHph_N1_15]|nr:hypothetical protein EVB77_141 [Rhizobium phage RHph_N1_10]QIG69343.1 hypothetical protein EVB78_141 [Rhizobium phage RHph_N1_15]QIG75203.1 hypothetical protein EVC15_141 [Rhizobium phage RHph_N2_6]
MANTSLPALTSYQKDLLAMIDPMIAAYGKQRFAIPGRRGGKTAAAEEIHHIIGQTITRIWVDDIERAAALKPEVVLDDPKWPAARVEIWRKEIEKRDPRNPNPKAGRIVSFELRGKCVTGQREFSSLDAAQMQAKMLHNRAILRSLREMQAANPMFGRF